MGLDRMDTGILGSIFSRGMDVRFVFLRRAVLRPSDEPQNVLRTVEKRLKKVSEKILHKFQRSEWTIAPKEKKVLAQTVRYDTNDVVCTFPPQLVCAANETDVS